MILKIPDTWHPDSSFTIVVFCPHFSLRSQEAECSRWMDHQWSTPTGCLCKKDYVVFQCIPYSHCNNHIPIFHIWYSRFHMFDAILYGHNTSDDFFRFAGGVRIEAFILEKSIYCYKTDGNKFCHRTRTAGATKCPQALYAQRLEYRVDAGVQKYAEITCTQYHQKWTAKSPIEEWKNTWLFKVYRGLYYPVIWGL